MLNSAATAIIPEDLGAVSFILNSNNLTSWKQKTPFKAIKQEFWTTAYYSALRFNGQICRSPRCTKAPHIYPSTLQFPVLIT
jgi:hypothetical protein